MTDVWSEALDLEARRPQEEAASRVVPTITSACEGPDVRAQFLQLSIQRRRAP